MADTARRVFCRTCGKEISVFDAKEYRTGRSVQYECIKCAKQGQRETYYHVRMVIRRREKMK